MTNFIIIVLMFILALTYSVADDNKFVTLKSFRMAGTDDTLKNEPIPPKVLAETTTITQYNKIYQNYMASHVEFQKCMELLSSQSALNILLIDNPELEANKRWIRIKIVQNCIDFVKKAIL